MYIKKDFLNKLQRSTKEKRKRYKNAIYIDRNENPIDYDLSIKKKLFKKINNLNFGEYPELENHEIKSLLVTIFISILSTTSKSSSFLAF